ncbi:MAG: WD40/YVTN/BNR-like repeat-containing protein [Streptosporangiaceae bacterium]
MTDRHDEIEDWLGAEVHPLAPPPGTFERVQRRARRRKASQLLVTAAAAVVVIAGAVIAPTVVPSLLASNSHHLSSAAVGSKTPGVTSTPANSTSKSSPPSSSSPATSSSAAAGGTALSMTTSGTPAPPNFQPTSITMISPSVGAVIGQAGTPGNCSNPDPHICTSLAGTSTDGQSWYGISAPSTGAPAGPTGAGQLRFLNIDHAWAYGPQLYASSDGGRSWTGPEDTHGLRVTDLETAGSRAFALLGRCQGTGASYASDCSRFTLYSTAEGSTSLQPVRLELPAAQRATAMGTAGLASSAMLVLTGGPAAGQGYLLAPSGAILTGSLAGSPWRYAGKAPCTPGAASGSGAPLGAQLAAGNTRLLINCASTAGGTGGTGGARTGTGSGSQQTKNLFASSSGGARWTKVSQPPADGQATSLATASQGQVVLATTAGIDFSPDGTTWQAATITGGPPPGGFRYVGMTSATQGVAVPANASLGEVYVTTDGGQTWTAKPIRG